MLCLFDQLAQPMTCVWGRDYQSADYSDRCRSAWWEVTLWVDDRAPARVTKITAVACRPQRAHRITFQIRSIFCVHLKLDDLPSVKILWILIASLSRLLAIDNALLSLGFRVESFNRQLLPSSACTGHPQGSAVRITPCTKHGGARTVSNKVRLALAERLFYKPTATTCSQVYE